MAMLLSNAGRLKPEIRLGQAIKEFEQILSSEQQASFLAARTIINTSSSVTDHVMQLMAEIDRASLARTGAGRRCFGPRMTKILESVQQFVSIGDVIIGGSQNLIACGVWSLMRVTLLTVSRFSSYIENLSALFMNVGRTAPRCQEIISLYPQSKTLRSLVIEYFLVIIQVCKRFMAICNKSLVGQLKMYSKDLDVQDLQESLLKWAQEIRDELQLEEARQSSKSRGLLSKLHAKSAENTTIGLRGRRLAHKLKLLDACTTFDYTIIWKQARKHGNATWFLDQENYRTWRDNANATVLVVLGKLGSGKTVTMANIVSDLHQLSNPYSVAYFFCQTDNTESLTFDTILRCFARQLTACLETQTIATLYEQYCLGTTRLDVEQLLHSDALRGRRVYFVLDGIDECTNDTRQTIVDFLGRIRTRLDIKICVSFRLMSGSRIRNELELLFPGHTLDLLMPETNIDIENFIQAKLEYSLEQDELQIGDPRIIFEIQQALQEGAKSMFLWVALQVENICRQKTDEAIREALRDLPQDLPETFRRILRRSNPSGDKYQKRLLIALVAALRPLTTEELREALSVVPFDITWNPRKHINNISSVLSTCGSLIYTDEEQSTVHFIHPSVKQFLLGHSHVNDEFHIDLEGAHATMSEITTTYLRYGVFDTQVSSTVLPRLEASQVAGGVLSSILQTRTSAKRVALHALRLRKTANFDVGQSLAASHLKYRMDPNIMNSTFHFHIYAKAYWLDHTKNLAVGTNEMLPIVLMMFSKHNVNFGNVSILNRLTRLFMKEENSSSVFVLRVGPRPRTQDLLAPPSLTRPPSPTPGVQNPNDIVFFSSDEKKVPRIQIYPPDMDTPEIFSPFEQEEKSPEANIDNEEQNSSRGDGLLWAIMESHLGLFRARIRSPRTGLRDILKVSKFLRLTRPYGHVLPQVLTTSCCLRLVCFSTLFKYHDISYMLLRRCRQDLSWQEILDRVLAITESPEIVAIALVFAQLESGYGNDRLYHANSMGIVTRNLSGRLSPDGRLISLEAGDLVTVMPAISKTQIETDVLSLRNHWKTQLGPLKTQPSPWNLAWKTLETKKRFLMTVNTAFVTKTRYATCCYNHGGILLAKHRLCSCCIPERYKGVLKQLGGSSTRPWSGPIPLE